MNPIKYLIVSVFVLMMLSCSDGSQVGVKINELIKKHKVTTVIIENDCTGSETESRTFDIKKIRIEQQFIKVGNEFINMGKIKTVTVDGKEMKILM